VAFNLDKTGHHGNSISQENDRIAPVLENRFASLDTGKVEGRRICPKYGNRQDCRRDMQLISSTSLAGGSFLSLT
jgi:hypothetical protein